MTLRDCSATFIAAFASTRIAPSSFEEPDSLTWSNLQSNQFDARYYETSKEKGWGYPSSTVTSPVTSSPLPELKTRPCFTIPLVFFACRKMRISRYGYTESSSPKKINLKPLYSSRKGRNRV